MQKARRHPTKGLRPLVSVWFQVYFTRLFTVLFTFPSRYLFTIGLLVVFSLSRWYWQFQTGFLWSRPTQDTANSMTICLYRAFTLCRFAFQRILIDVSPYDAVLQPPRCRNTIGFGLFRFRSPLLTKSLLFSFPMPTQMFQFSTFAPAIAGNTSSRYWVAPFGNPRINEYRPLLVAQRSLSRPSSPPRAKASPIRPYILLYLQRRHA